MNRLLLIITLSLITQLSFAQDAPVSIYQGPVIIGIPGFTSTTTIRQNSIEINQAAAMDNSKILKLKAEENKNDIDSKGIPLVLNGINGQNVGVGGVPNEIPGALNVTLDVHKGQNDAPIRVRELPFGNFPIVTVDNTGVLYQSGYTPHDLMGPLEGDHLGNHQATQWLDMNQNKIINLDDPIDPLDAVNKAYVDGIAATADANIMAIIATLQAQIAALQAQVD